MKFRRCGKIAFVREQPGRIRVERDQRRQTRAIMRQPVLACRACAPENLRQLRARPGDRAESSHFPFPGGNSSAKALPRIAFFFLAPRTASPPRPTVLLLAVAHEVRKRGLPGAHNNPRGPSPCPHTRNCGRKSRWAPPCLSIISARMAGGQQGHSFVISPEKRWTQPFFSPPLSFISRRKRGIQGSVERMSSYNPLDSPLSRE